ncbi:MULTISPECIES: TomO hydrophobic C-terminal domain-containing protein [unclassified Wolbachia]|uniref:TomO hydrophobic C-terminal domain-containing protein n=1 Tax=unclassified Wolbachia TaxID=2640676 RepID=UPI0021F88F39|nr:MULTISPECIES: hypothetical protein [unclassified Wolbachia]
MFGSHFRDFVSQEQDQSNKVLKKSNSRDSGTEEEFEILGQEEIKERRHSEDSGNCSEAEETNRAIELEFQLTQFLLSQVKADENNRNANSGKQAYKDLPRMDFVINGQVIDKNFVSQLRDKCNQNDQRQIAKHVFTKMFEHAKAEIPNDNLLEELINSCNQAGYDGSLLMQLSPIFLGHDLQLPDANDRHIEIVCSDQDSLNIKYCPNMPVKQLGKEICRVDAILEFTLKSQDGKVEYEDGKVTLTIPEQLKNYKVDGKSLLDDIKMHFEDVDNAIIESLLENIDEGQNSFVVDLPTEVNSDSFDIIPEDTVFDLGHIPELVKKAVDDKDVNALANHIGFFQDHVTHVSSKEGLPVVEKTLEIVSGFTKEQSKPWRCYPTVPIASHIYSVKQQYCDGYISQEGYEKLKKMEETLCKIKSDLIKISTNDYNQESPVKNAQDTSAILNEAPTSSQTVNGEQLNTKESKNQQLQRNVVDKGENIMDNEEASIEESAGNNHRRGKVPKSIKTIEEKLSNAINSIDFRCVENLLAPSDTKVDKSILQKLLDQANDKMKRLQESKGKKNKQKSNLTKIITFLEDKLKHTAATLPVDNNVEAAASSQEVPLVESEGSESDSLSLSSEGDDFSKLEGDNSAETSSSSTSFEVIDETEAPKTAELEATAAMPLMATEEKSDDLNDKKDDQQNLTATTVSSSVNENTGSNSASEEESSGDFSYYYDNNSDADNDQEQDIQSEDTLPEPEILATSALPEATATGNASSNSVPCTSRVELTSDDEDEFLSIEIEDVNNDINVNQPTGHVEQVANGNGQPKTELPRINEQSSKSNQKTTVPQNTKKYVVAASALAITGIALGAAVAVYLEMLAIGVAVAACCLIAATITYCYRPKSLVEDNEVKKVDDTQKSTPCCG